MGRGWRVQVEHSIFFFIFLYFKWGVVEEYRLNLLSFSSFYILSGTWSESTGWTFYLFTFLSFKWDVVEEYRLNILSFLYFYLLNWTWSKSTGWKVYLLTRGRNLFANLYISPKSQQFLLREWRVIGHSCQLIVALMIVLVLI